MIIKQLVKEDFINYKKRNMFIGFPKCTWKCEIECGCRGMCQNSSLALSPDINISNDRLINEYINNPITESIVCGGLEPFESWDDLYSLIKDFRDVCDDDFVIYTGFDEEEIKDKIDQLSKFKNIVIKFGRYKPNEEKHFDDVLGVNLASNNQYAKKIS